MQVVFSRNIAAGFTGALTIGVLASLFAAGSLMPRGAALVCAAVATPGAACHNAPRRAAIAEDRARGAPRVLCPRRRRFSHRRRVVRRARLVQLVKGEFNVETPRPIAVRYPPGWRPRGSRRPSRSILITRCPSFSVDHLGLSTVIGRFDKSTGKVTFDRAAKTGSVEMVIPTATVTTGDADKGSWPRSRDDHLRTSDFFNVAEFPQMTFKSTRVHFTGETRRRSMAISRSSASPSLSR